MVTAAVVGIVALAAAGLGLVLSSSGRPAPARPAAAAPRQSPRPAPAKRATVPASTELATVLATAPGYARPGQQAGGRGSGSAGPARTVPASWYDRPSVLPVIGTKPGWVEVRLAQRPNGSTAWLPASDVKLSSTPYRIVVNTAATKLSLYDHGKLVFSAPAGVGTTDDPTPLGEYFVAFDEPPPSAGYGPFIMVTSAHSPAISDWEGSGDAVIGIHGPLGMDTAIGTKGARISHGCVRLHDAALEKLSKVPAGTPVDVIS